MAFNLEILFTGICSFVPDNPDLAKVTKLCVVLPNGTKAHSTLLRALDGRRLRRHHGMLRFPLGSYAPGDHALPAEAEGFWLLDRRRLRLELGDDRYKTEPLRFHRLSDAAMAQAIQDMADGKMLTPDQQRGYQWLLQLSRIAPGPCDVDPLVVSEAPPMSVLCQFVLGGGGEVSTGKLPTRTLWTFSPNLSEEPMPETHLAHGMLVSYQNVTTVRVVAESLDDPKDVKAIQLAGEDGATIRVLVSNMCDENPLEWDYPAPPVRDEDTRWLYELLSPDSKKTIRSVLPATGLPLPQPVSTAGGGPNCIPDGKKGYPFPLLP